MPFCFHSFAVLLIRFLSDALHAPFRWTTSRRLSRGSRQHDERGAENGRGDGRPIEDASRRLVRAGYGDHVRSAVLWLAGHDDPLRLWRGQGWELLLLLLVKLLVNAVVVVAAAAVVVAAAAAAAIGSVVVTIGNNI